MRTSRCLSMSLVVAMLAALVALPAAAQPERRSGGASDGVRKGASQALTLDQLQSRGTHNSYKLDPQWPGRELLGFDYGHLRLSRQLEEQGVRQVEIDVHWNWARGEFEVYHAWLGDDHTNCLALTDCLAEIRWWSEQRPDHHPIMILVEPKDGGPPKNLTEPADGDPFTHPIEEPEYQELDRVLLDAFGGSVADGGRVLTPADVTLPGATLRTSILTRGWPTIDELRGHVIYVIDGNVTERDRPSHYEHGFDYSRGWTSLEGRAAFVQAEPFHDVAAFVSRDGQRLAGEGKYDRIRRLVADGFLVRDLVQPGGFEDAKDAGVHFLSTDFPEELELSQHPHAPSRCNPVSAAVSCQDVWIERRAGDDPIELPDEPEDDQLQVLVDQVVDRLVGRSVGSATAFAERSADDPELVVSTLERQLEVWATFLSRLADG